MRLCVHFLFCFVVLMSEFEVSVFFWIRLWMFLFCMFFLSAKFLNYFLATVIRYILIQYSCLCTSRVFATHLDFNVFSVYIYIYIYIYI